MDAPPLIRSLRRALCSQAIPLPRAMTTTPAMTTLAMRCAWRQGARLVQVQLGRSLTSSAHQKQPQLDAKLTSTDAPAAAAEAAAPPADPAEDVRLPRSVQALYLKPLRRECEYGVPSADLQLRSYSKRSLEFFCDFALRAAYYLGLPAFGPVPLPRITERWTVTRSHFIHKKSKENFERVTLRRLIQIRDGHPDAVQVWLAFLKKHAYAGVGMKANVWEYSTLDVAREMDAAAKELEGQLEPEWAHMGEGLVSISGRLGGRKTPEELLAAGKEKPDPAAVEELKELLASERKRFSGGL